MDNEDLPENLIINDHNGIPDHAINPQQIAKDSFALACRIGASRGDQDTITKDERIREPIDVGS